MEKESVYAKFVPFWEWHENKVTIAGITHFFEETVSSYRILKTRKIQIGSLSSSTKTLQH